MLELEKLQSLIRPIPDFPKPGILFRDINPLLGDASAFSQVIELLAEPLRDRKLTKVLGIESRGFILGASLAKYLKLGFVPLRKPGKLPGKLYSESYQLEYGEDQLQVQVDALKSTDRVLIVDDVLATGGTAETAVRLADRFNVEIYELLFLVEIKALDGRRRFSDQNLRSLFQF